MRLLPVLTSVAAIIGMAAPAHADADDEAFRTHKSGHYLLLNTSQNSGASQGRWSSRSTTGARPVSTRSVLVVALGLRHEMATGAEAVG